MLDTCVELFARQAQANADAIAVCADDDEITYRELDDRSNRLAHRLVAEGVRPEDLVGLFLSPSVDLIVALLAIHKAGAAYVPLDPTHPDHRLSHVRSDADLRWVITSPALSTRDLVGADEIATIMVGDPLLSSEPGDRPPRRSSPDDLAYVIYTSGSTGLPKGVMVTQRNMSRLFLRTQPWFQFTEQDVWTLFHSAAFDFSVWEIWGPLIHGGRLVVVPHEVSRSPAEFRRLLAEQRVTVLNQTPSAFSLLARIEEGYPISSRLETLRYVVFGGEALDPRSLRSWVERYGIDRPALVNMYGITETTVHVTYHEVTCEEVLGTRQATIGKPIPDLEVWLHDDQGKPVIPGEIGEIVIRGPGVARGYLNRPELDQERFPHLPDASHARVYRSGDLARRLPNGDLVYCGRSDDQVKIRGFRIELGEIETALLEHSMVRRAVACRQRDDTDTDYLAAYVTSVDPELAVEELRTHLCALLPSHMVPRALSVVPEFPLTSNGKIDKERLAEAVATGFPEQVAPTGDRLIDTIAGMWALVLGRTSVGPDDNYFLLGGDSLRSAELLRLCAEQGIQLGFRDLLNHQTVRELSHVVMVRTGSPSPDNLRVRPEPGRAGVSCQLYKSEVYQDRLACEAAGRSTTTDASSAPTAPTPPTPRDPPTSNAAAPPPAEAQRPDDATPESPILGSIGPRTQHQPPEHTPQTSWSAPMTAFPAPTSSRPCGAGGQFGETARVFTDCRSVPDLHH